MAKQKIIALCKKNTTQKVSLLGQECSEVWSVCEMKIIPICFKPTESTANDFQVLYLVKMPFRKFSL